MTKKIQWVDYASIDSIEKNISEIYNKIEQLKFEHNKQQQRIDELSGSVLSYVIDKRYSHGYLYKLRNVIQWIKKLIVH